MYGSIGPIKTSASGFPSFLFSFFRACAVVYLNKRLFIVCRNRITRIVMKFSWRLLAWYWEKFGFINSTWLLIHTGVYNILKCWSFLISQIMAVGFLTCLIVGACFWVPPSCECSHFKFALVALLYHYFHSFIVTISFLFHYINAPSALVHRDIVARQWACRKVRCFNRM